MGIRLCPPARTLASLPCRARAASADARSDARSYSNGAGFMPPTPLAQGARLMAYRSFGVILADIIQATKGTANCSGAYGVRGVAGAVSGVACFALPPWKKLSAV